MRIALSRRKDSGTSAIQSLDIWSCQTVRAFAREYR